MSISRTASAVTSPRVSSHTTGYPVFSATPRGEGCLRTPTSRRKADRVMIDSFRRLLDQPVRTDEPKLCFLENQVDVRPGSLSPDGQRLDTSSSRLARSAPTAGVCCLIRSERSQAQEARAIPAQPFKNPSRVFSGCPVRYIFFR